MATKSYIKQHSTAFGDNSIQLGGKNYIKLRVRGATAKKTAPNPTKITRKLSLIYTKRSNYMHNTTRLN